jgi:hypothetical protein
MNIRANLPNGAEGFAAYAGVGQGSGV